MWHSERLDVLWVGGGISSVKASASTIQFVVQLWLAPAGAIPMVPAALTMVASVCMHGEDILLACWFNYMYRSRSTLESHPVVHVDSGLSG